LRPRAQKKGTINKARRFAEGLGYPSRLGHARWRAFLTEEQRTQLLTPGLESALRRDPFSHIGEILDRAPSSLGALERAQWVDFHSYLPDNCLVKVDRMSMLCSLEVRVPLLDTTLVDLAFSLPEELKINGTRTKILLKELAARRVPREAVYRAKEGFSMPMKQWLNTSLAERLDDELSPATLGAQGLFEPKVVERLIREHRSNVANHSHLLWTLLVFHDWRRRWKVG
jgi:asparagine synthase (glutamine-hydrolysing)